MVDLHLATNKELMDELVNRHSFCGIIIHSMDEHRDNDQVHKRFGMKSRCGKDKETVIELLAHMIKGLESSETN